MRVLEHLNGLGDRMKRSVPDMKLNRAMKENNSELFSDDSGLRTSLDTLEEVHESISALWQAIDLHGKDMMNFANTERALGMQLTNTGSSVVPMFEKYISKERVNAQLAMGAAEVTGAQLMQRFAQDMSNPIREFHKAFDDKYRNTITPLKKRYVSQKSEYLKYCRQLTTTEDENRRNDLMSLRDAARPIWEKTSESLKEEADKLAMITVRDMNVFLIKLAQVRRNTMVKIAEHFRNSAEQAAKVKL
mmetsp:Transcript_13739/g.28203  ORF Transcript_13739/g.28203 Transcript_13739/m.28203 type:complete len:247 (-) Transcript_13739:358-1098(-)